MDCTARFRAEIEVALPAARLKVGATPEGGTPEWKYDWNNIDLKIKMSNFTFLMFVYFLRYFFVANII